jgi:hypothetical protein
MIRVFVDISVFVQGESFGRVSGIISLSTLPGIGDLIWLNHTYLSPKVLTEIASLPLVRVMERTMIANHDSEVSLGLSELDMDTPLDALKAMHGLEAAHGLTGERFGE